jgi:hypothetical protein
MSREHPEFPPTNRKPQALPILRIEIEHQDGTLVIDPNRFVLEAIGGALLNLPVLEASKSDLSGQAAVCYRSDDLEIFLTPEELTRLALLSLQPEQYFALRAKYGMAHQWHDDFYDEETGEAVQPREEATARLFPGHP